MAIKCHSGFVHYNMFHDRHSHSCGNIIGSVFNVTNNCSGNHTGFWGGLGAGLGWGLGNFLGGFTSMFTGFGMGLTNMFGGFGNMFGGFGMPGLFGGFGGFGDFWGGGFSSVDNSSKYTSKHTDCKCGCGDANDEDCPKIADYQKEINGLAELEPTELTDEKYNEIKGRIEADRALSEKDSKNKTANLKSYDELLVALDKAFGKVSTPPVAEVVEENEEDGVVTIGGNKVEINNITINVVNDWTENDISGLSAEKAKAVLVKLGFIIGDVGKISSDYKILLLLQKSGVNVECATNPDSKDPMIQGKIENVTLVGDKVSYTVDNSTANGDFQFKYSFQQVEDKDGKKCFHLTKIENNGSEDAAYIDKDWKTRDYIHESDGEPLKITGTPLVSKHNNNGRIKLEEELE